MRKRLTWQNIDGHDDYITESWSHDGGSSADSSSTNPSSTGTEAQRRTRKGVVDISSFVPRSSGTPPLERKQGSHYSSMLAGLTNYSRMSRSGTPRQLLGNHFDLDTKVQLYQREITYWAQMKRSGQ